MYFLYINELHQKFLEKKKKKYFCSNLIYKYFIHKVIIIYIVSTLKILIVS